MAIQQVDCGRSGMISKYSSDIVQKVPWGGPLKLGIDEIKREIIIYEKLGPHPRILKYFGPKGSGLLLEYHQRGCLRAVLYSSTDIPSIKWARQITEGVQYIHQRGLIHCDLSARNVLITDDSNAVLADFGGCSIDGQQELGLNYDVSCSRPGQDESKYIPIDDLFALGSIIYEIYTKKEPYDGKTEQEITKFYKQGEFPKTSDLELGNIINKCWQASYADATEVLRDIDKVSLASTQNHVGEMSQISLPAYDTPTTLVDSSIISLPPLDTGIWKWWWSLGSQMLAYWHGGVK